MINQASEMPRRLLPSPVRPAPEPSEAEREPDQTDSHTHLCKPLPQLPKTTQISTVRARARCCGRGAAVVEALVAIPFFVVIFASIVYVGRLYSEKQRVMRVSKEYAWTMAMSNCSNNNGVVKTDAMSPVAEAATQDTNGAISASTLNEYGDLSAGDVFKTNMGRAESTVEGKVSASRLIGGFSNKLVTTTRVQCNEAPKGSNPVKAITSAWQELTPW